VTEPIHPKRFLTYAQVAWFSFDREFEHYDLADLLHLSCPPQTWDGYTDRSGMTLNPTPAQPFPAITPATLSAVWRAQLEKLRELGKPFTFFGIFNGGKLPEGPGYGFTGCLMPEAEYRHLMDRVGDLFIGWDLGEFDGLYGRDIAFYWKPEELPKTRPEAHARFMDYLRRLHGYVYQNACTIVGCTFPHYFHELGIRMLGAEVGQALLNYQVYTSFLRGAKRQYGLESKIITSVFDRWGYTCYAKDIEPASMPDEHGGKIVFRADAFAGHSIGLHHAMWLIGYFAGAAAMGLDGGFYADALDERGVRMLSPLGRSWMSFREWARSPLPRGEQVRPLALLLDYHSGWTPPRHLYSMKHFTVWHSLPYGPADYGMDRAYDLFYPGYTDSGFYRDERGFVAPTPEGDVVDVLLSDAAPEALAAYPILWQLSDNVPGETFSGRLRDYVENGGHLIVSGAAMTALARDWFGIAISDDRKPAVHAVLGATGECIRENYYAVRVLPLDQTWNVSVVTEAGDPLLATRQTGRGQVTFLAADHGLTDRLTAPGLDMNARWDYTPEHPFELLHCIQRQVKQWVRQAMPVTVDAPGLYYAVNRLAPDDYTACLYNPGQTPLTGVVRCHLKDPCVRELTGPWSTNLLNGLTVAVPANELTVLQLSRAQNATP
jgi:hypothetical protein